VPSRQPEAVEDAVVASPVAAPTTPTSITTPTMPDSLPIATVQPTPVRPHFSVFRAFANHISTDPQARLWFIILLFLLLIVRLLLSPSLSLIFVAVTYSGFWMPQIVRSVRRGRSSSLSAEYLIGTSVCRSLMALYFLGCPKNVLDVEVRPWVWWLVAFVFLQVAVILLQQRFGPGFFLPQSYAPVKIYDYHPPIPLPPLDSPNQTLGDCAICMDDILVDSAMRDATAHEGHAVDDEKKSFLDVVLLHEGEPAGGRKTYSLAPCQHLFHTECLETWLAIKNICPQCRRPLPPL